MTRYALPLILLLALIARLAAWGLAERQVASRGGRFVVAGDAEGYWDLAGDIALGRPYAVHTPPRRVMRTPGLPLVLAGSRAVFGDSPTAARGLLAVLSVMGPLAVYLLGREVADHATGLLAASLAAVSPLIVGFSPLLLSESLFGLMITSQCLRLARLIRCTTATRLADIDPRLGQLETMMFNRSGSEIGDEVQDTFDRELRDLTPRLIARLRVKAALQVGVAGACACYLRPAWAPAMAVLVVGWIAVYRSRAAVRDVALITAAFGVLWAPWVIRNAIVTGRPVLTTHWTGPTLYDSVGPQADGTSDMTFFDAEADRRAGLTEAEMNAWYARRSIEAMTADPLRVARLAVAKQARFWSLAPSAKEAGPVWLRLPIAVWTLGFFGLALIGLRGSSARAIVVCLGPVAILAGIHLLFVASMRYRIPAELPLCVLAAVGLQSCRQRFSRGTTIV